MQEQDSVEDPPAACRHGKDALGRPVVADGLGRLCGLVVRSPFRTCLCFCVCVCVCSCFFLLLLLLILLLLFLLFLLLLLLWLVMMFLLVTFAFSQKQTQTQKQKHKAIHRKPTNSIPLPLWGAIPHRATFGWKSLVWDASTHLGIIFLVWDPTPRTPVWDWKRADPQNLN